MSLIHFTETHPSGTLDGDRTYPNHPGGARDGGAETVRQLLLPVDGHKVVRNQDKVHVVVVGDVYLGLSDVTILLEQDDLCGGYLVMHFSFSLQAPYTFRTPE